MNEEHLPGASLKELSRSWLNTKQAGKGLAANTEKTYREALAAWGTALADLHEVAVPDAVEPLDVLRAEHLTEDAIIACAAAFHRQGFAERTRAVRITVIRGLCKWLTRKRYLPFDPAVDLESPRIPSRLPVSLSDDDLGRLVAAVSTPHTRSSSQWITRDRALVATFAGGGPRASEVVHSGRRLGDGAQRQGGRTLTGLAVGDLIRDRDGAFLRLRGKGDKDRIVPVDALVVETIDIYQAEREALAGAYEMADPLFVTRTGEPMTTSMLEYQVDLWFRRAGVHRPEGELAHAFRHTYAVGVLRSGGSLNELQAALGHEDLATTGIYTRLAADQLLDLAKTSPVLAHLRATSTDLRDPTV